MRTVGNAPDVLKERDFEKRTNGAIDFCNEKLLPINPSFKQNIERMVANPVVYTIKEIEVPSCEAPASSYSIQSLIIVKIKTTYRMKLGQRGRGKLSFLKTYTDALQLRIKDLTMEHLARSFNPLTFHVKKRKTLFLAMESKYHNNTRRARR